MNFKYLFNSIVTVLVLPIIYYQGKKIKANTPKLQEAKGFEGESFQDFNNALNLITLGDSSMAGVGVKTHKEGFIGTLADELASHYSINVYWKVYAKSGFTTLKVKDILIPTIQEKKLDLIVIGIGGNDAFKLTNPKEWICNIKSLIADIRSKYKSQPIVFTNMPPVREIPAFTYLIKYIMGNLIDAYSDELVKLVKNTDNVFYCSSRISYSDYTKRYNLNSHPNDFFSDEDKFHPSKLAYQIWAKDISNFIIKEKVIKNLSI
jgi:lysophospholipase L1-like esterase